MPGFTYSPTAIAGDEPVDIILHTYPDNTLQKGPSVRRILGIAVAMTGSILLVLTAFTPAEAASATKTAQQQLRQLGCQPGAIDGRLGDRTKAALIRFQAANGLRQTGELGDLTRAKLKKSDAIHCDDRPVPEKTGTGRRIVMSQKQNWIWLVRANGTVAHQGGMIDSPSKVKPGVHYTGSKCGRAAKIRKNKSYDYKFDLDYFVRIVACGIGFHRVPTYPGTDRQIHEDYLLGTNRFTSSGCVRVSLETSKKIWDFTPTRTKLVVVADR